MLSNRQRQIRRNNLIAIWHRVFTAFFFVCLFAGLGYGILARLLTP